MKFCGVALLTAIGVCCATAFAQDGSAKWKKFEYPNLGFSVSLPGTPDIRTEKLPPTTMYTLHVTSDIIVNVIVVEYPGGECEKNLNSIKEEAMGQGFGIQEISGDGYSGYEFEDNGPVSGNYVRQLCAHRKLYVIAGSWPVGNPKPDVITRFVNSFHLMSSAPAK